MRSLVDYTPWRRPEAWIRDVGRVKYQRMVDDGRMELHTVQGLDLARRIWTRDPRPSRRGWYTYSEAGEILGVVTRALEYRVARGKMRRRYVDLGNGRYQWEVWIDAKTARNRMDS